MTLELSLDNSIKNSATDKKTKTTLIKSLKNTIVGNPLKIAAYTTLLFLSTVNATSRYSDGFFNIDFLEKPQIVKTQSSSKHRISQSNKFSINLETILSNPISTISSGITDIISKTKITTEKSIDKLIEINKQKSNEKQEQYIEIDEKLPKKHKITSVEGQFYRTARWDEYITKAEKKYGTEEGLIAGLIMAESRGDPLALNGTRDGGAGLGMIMPGVALSYGFIVLDDCTSVTANFNHGKKLSETLKEYNYDYEKLKIIDERFNIEKSVDLMGQILFKLNRKYGNSNDSLSAYNRGRPAKYPEQTNHVIRVRLSQIFYLEQKQKMGIEIDTEHLNNLKQKAGHYFKIVDKNQQYSTFEYCVNYGDNIGEIAESFNVWDMRNGNKYSNISEENIVDIENNNIQPEIFPNQKIRFEARINQNI